MQLNMQAMSHAMDLVKAGKVDKTSPWDITPDDENKMLGQADKPDWAAYGNMHLGIDGSANEETKARHKYPFGKNGEVYRSAVIAAKQRAAAQGETDIENAASKLLTAIDGPEKHADLSDVEIFASGTYRGKTYTDADLDQMVKNFDSLKDEIKPTLVVGHSEDQALLKDSGIPAAGWMTGVKRAGSKLLASFKEVPAVLADLIKKKAYARTSSEIYTDYNGRGLALRRVALLGGEIPEVKTLKDVAALYAEPPTGNTAWVELSEEDPEKKRKEALHMEKLEKLQEQFAKLSERLTTVEAENKALKTEKDNMLTKLSESEKKALRAEISAFCEGLKKEGKLLPAWQDMGLERFMEGLDSVAVVKFSEKEEMSASAFMRKFLSSMPNIVKFGELAPGARNNNPGSAAEQLSEKVKAKMDKNDKLTYSEAFAEVQRENPDLANEYVSEYRKEV